METPDKFSLNEIQNQFGINFDERFETKIVVKGKSPIDKPVLEKMSIILEVYV